MSSLALLASLALAGAASPGQEGPSVGLEIDLSGLPKDEITQGLGSFLREHQTEVIEDVGLRVSQDADYVIRTKVTRYGDGDIHSRADLTLLTPRGDAPAVERTVLCEVCRDGELVIRVGEQVGKLSARVLYAPPQETEEEPGEPPPPQESPPPQEASEAPSPTLDPPAERVKALGPLGYGGLASLAGGAITMAVGIPLSLRQDDVRAMPGRAEIRSTRPTGIAMASVGAAVLVAGAVMVSVDVITRRRKRRVSLQPAAGLGVTGRF